MQIDRRRYVAALAVLSMGAMMALAAPVSADSLQDGPWSKAKIGTSISYRVNQYQPMPGAPPKSAVITEEVVEMTPDAVTVKITRKEAGTADRTSTGTRPRRISGEQLDQVLKGLGSDRRGVDIKVSDQTFSCRQYEREYESSDGNPDHAVKVRTMFCREVPGWLAGQRASSVSWKSDEVRFELLEVTP